MTEKEIEKLALWAANKLNGGDWYDQKFYQAGHKKAWMDMVRELADKLKESNRLGEEE